MLRVLRRGRDARFDEMRGDCLAFFGFWVFQMLWVFVVSLPVVLVNVTPAAGAFGSDARDVVGAALWAVGFLVEWAADDAKELLPAPEVLHRHYDECYCFDKRC